MQNLQDNFSMHSLLHYGCVPIQRMHPSKDSDFKGHAFEGRKGPEDCSCRLAAVIAAVDERQ